MRTWIDAEIKAEIERLSAMGGELVVARACALYGADPEDVLKGSRKTQNIRARQASAWLLRRNGLSYPQIGHILGVDHTTALYACRKIDGSPSVRALLLGIEAAA
jgi:chromosomal replication initiation ATPase DnaA